MNGPFSMAMSNNQRVTIQKIETRPFGDHSRPIYCNIPLTESSDVTILHPDYIFMAPFFSDGVLCFLTKTSIFNQHWTAISSPYPSPILRQGTPPGHCPVVRRSLRRGPLGSHASILWPKSGSSFNYINGIYPFKKKTLFINIYIYILYSYT